MRSKFFVMVCLAMSSLLANASSPTAVQFFSGSLPSAKAQAQKEGKLVFVDFTAQWCLPCQWMDETTFNDPQIADFIAENYIAIKIDVEHFDGVVWKEQYNIKMLPSMLILNAKGEMLERVEESLPSSRLMEMLQNQNFPEKPAYIPQTTPQAYDDTRFENYQNQPAEVYTNEEPAVYTNANYPVIENSEPPFQAEQPTEMPTYEAPSVVVPPAPEQPVYETTPDRFEGGMSPVATGEGLFAFDVKRVPSNGYSVQIGAFAEYGNVLTEVDRLKDIFAETVLIHIANINGKTVYKILVGSFNTRAEAATFQQHLSNQGMPAITKDLTLMR